MSFLDDEPDEDEEPTEDNDDDVVDLDEDDYEMKTADDDGMIRPVVEDLDEIAKGFEQFQAVKSKLLDKEDLQTISGQPFITKSGWRKIATAFGVSTQVTNKEKEVNDGVITYTITAQAKAPNGQVANGMGSCSSNESNFMVTVAGDTEEDSPEEVAKGHMAATEDDLLIVDGAYRVLKDPREVDHHSIMATAATRAKNRAISDLVGGGEVSAEELDADQLIN